MVETRAESSALFFLLMLFIFFSTAMARCSPFWMATEMAWLMSRLLADCMDLSMARPRADLTALAVTTPVRRLMRFCCFLAERTATACMRARRVLAICFLLARRCISAFLARVPYSLLVARRRLFAEWRRSLAIWWRILFMFMLKESAMRFILRRVSALFFAMRERSSLSFLMCSL